MPFSNTQLTSGTKILPSISTTLHSYTTSLPHHIHSLITLYLRFLSTMFPARSDVSLHHHGRMLYNVQTSSQSAWITMIMGMASSFFIFGLTFLLYVIYIKWRWWHEMIVPRGFLGDKLAVKFRMDKIRHWMSDVIKMKEADVIKHCGLDGAVFVRFFTVYIQVSWGVKKGDTAREFKCVHSCRGTLRCKPYSYSANPF